jgi:uncharacterized protein
LTPRSPKKGRAVRVKTLLALVLAVVFCGPVAARAQTTLIAGDWEGTLKTPARDLRFVLHVTPTDSGEPTATLDSIDQSALGIPVSSIAVTGTSVTFAVSAVRGTYRGTLSVDRATIDGSWLQGVEMPLRLKRTAHVDAVPSDIDGTWSGTLQSGNVSIRLLIHVTNTPYGLVSSLDSPDQNARGIAATIARQGANVTVESKQIRAGFEGKLDAARTTLDGNWSQGGKSTPLVLTRERNVVVRDPKRPQNPVKPYPYREENVAYDNTTAGITLAATLTIPPGAGPFPAVVLITGSGAQNRDETIAGHRPFLVLADYLTRHGIVVLRADDRGVGLSGGNFATANTADFATDTAAGVRYLRTRREVNLKRIGLIGHSEGGIIAPLVAGRDHDIAFIVLMAGSGIPGDDIIVEQGALMMKAIGMSAEQIDVNSGREREVLRIVKEEKDPAVRNAKLQAALAVVTPAESIPEQIRALTSPWYRYFISYDPAIALKDVTCPVLAINGERDLQVPAAQNLAAIKKALESAGNTRVTTVELPGLNHLFQTARTGLPAEYEEIEETLAPIALETVANWILKQ